MCKNSKKHESHAIDHKSIIFSILRLESLAGRVEGIFAADPELALMWRVQAALTEACRSVGLEDIHVFEGDVISRPLENRATDAEGARGAAAVAELLRVIVAPGDIRADPEFVLGRCWRAAVNDDAASIASDATPIDLAEIAKRIQLDLHGAPTPFVGALRASIIFRLMSDSRSPSADRLVFMAAEHALRGGGHSRDIGAAHPEALLSRMNAGWIMTPATALTQGRFNAWSPGSDDGQDNLMSGLTLEMERTLGAIPLMRRWREDARSRAGEKHGKSRLLDLVDLAIREPILTSARVRELLGMSDRGALYLMRDAEETGILSLITPRTTYRVWAVPAMARTLQMRSSRIGRGRDKSSDRDAPRQDSSPIDAPATEMVRGTAGRLESDGYEDRAAAAMAALDEAMAGVDAVMKKYRNPKETS